MKFNPVYLYPLFNHLYPIHKKYSNQNIYLNLSFLNSNRFKINLIKK